MFTYKYSRRIHATAICVAVCCIELQCVAVCCAVCCSVLQYVAVCCSVFQCVAVCCSVLQCVAVCCSVLQCVAVCCSMNSYLDIPVECMRLHNILQHTATHCNTLPQDYNTLQHTATHRNTPQHTATYCGKVHVKKSPKGAVRLL